MHEAWFSELTDFSVQAAPFYELLDRGKSHMIAAYICSSEGAGGGIPRQTVIPLNGAGGIFVVQLIAVVPVEVKRYAEAGGHGLVPGNLFGRNSSC